MQQLCSLSNEQIPVTRLSRAAGSPAGLTMGKIPVMQGVLGCGQVCLSVTVVASPGAQWQACSNPPKQ